MLEGMLGLTVFGVTGGEVRLAMVMVVDGGGKGRRGGDIRARVQLGGGKRWRWWTCMVMGMRWEEG